jgi:MtN3 and saliva related transmembrane protein
MINPLINMLNTEIIGLLAAILTTVAFIPQAFKALRYRDTRSLSLGMYVIFTAGVALWGIYGWLLGNWVIVTANAVTGTLAIAILVTKLRYDVFGDGP